METSEDTKLGNWAVPEIYYDVIARIVPGALILALFRWASGKGFNLGNITIALILSYFIGLLLNLIALQFWHVAFFERQEFWQKHWKNATKYINDNDLWLWIRSRPLVDRNLYTKMMAEKLLFATLSIASPIAVGFTAFTILHCPLAACGFCSIKERYCPVAIVAVACLVGILSFAFFSWCMFRVNQWLSEPYRRTQESTAATA